jgi:hypothetical protein
MINEDSELWRSIKSQYSNPLTLAKLRWELSRVVQAGVYIEDDKPLIDAFTWLDAPQGDNFWADVYHGDYDG